MSGWYRVRALAMALACIVSAHGSAEAQVRGMATFSERVTLPADAVFEASLVDVSLGGEPDAVIGRTRIEGRANRPSDSRSTTIRRASIRGTVRGSGSHDRRLAAAARRQSQ